MFLKHDKIISTLEPFLLLFLTAIFLLSLSLNKASYFSFSFQLQYDPFLTIQRYRVSNSLIPPHPPSLYVTSPCYFFIAFIILIIIPLICYIICVSLQPNPLQKNMNLSHLIRLIHRYLPSIEYYLTNLGIQYIF